MQNATFLALAVSLGIFHQIGNALQELPRTELKQTPTELQQVLDVVDGKAGDKSTKPSNEADESNEAVFFGILHKTGSVLQELSPVGLKQTATALLQVLNNAGNKAGDNSMKPSHEAGESEKEHEGKHEHGKKEHEGKKGHDKKVAVQREHPLNVWCAAVLWGLFSLVGIGIAVVTYQVSKSTADFSAGVTFDSKDTIVRWREN
mmetsp:Transcript_42131/g.83339  ORF Transcript_42131/g.83339 Transcript_42131/m.83339 type:complete len:204 (-) Transcript_42131:11-622(-)